MNKNKKIQKILKIKKLLQKFLYSKTQVRKLQLILKYKTLKFKVKFKVRIVKQLISSSKIPKINKMKVFNLN